MSSMSGIKVIQKGARKLETGKVMSSKIGDPSVAYKPPTPPSSSEPENSDRDVSDESNIFGDVTTSFFTAKDSGTPDRSNASLSASFGSSMNNSKVTRAEEEQEQQIVQTTEDLRLKIENDRTKRFDYLLKQAEIYGHFMKPAYEKALKFEQETSQGTEPEVDYSESLSTTSRGSSKGGGGNATKKSKTLEILGASSQASTSYVSQFEKTPSYIKWGKMRDYQVRGLNWLISLFERGLSGILADEMGLGKTVQTISLLGYLKHHRGINGPHLIIAPKSTLPNWMHELNQWCPSLKAICLIGGKEERPSFIKKTFLPRRWNVCVTSYEMARIEKTTLAKINYHYVVIDEAQKIKNENSLLATCVRQFKSTARLLLTGTPLQNNLHELWALLNFLLPDVFSSSDDFDEWFNESNCMGNQTLVDRLHGVLRPFLLRRIKSDVEKSLPPKTELRLYVQLTPMQREWYRKILIDDINLISDTTGKVAKMRLQNILVHLRKVCNHPYLFPGAEPKPFTTDTHIVTNSGKMIVLDKLLMKLKEQNSRVLLFSQMTRLLDILEDYCIWRGFEYCRLDGSTDYDIRQEDIDAFNAPNSSKFIYLLSTRAGGLGINLATADIVILYDSDWNPQMDLQAMDRAHRIGQKKEVKVFRFVVQDTVEEKIVERAVSKLHLDRMVIQQGRLLGSEAKGPTGSEMLNLVRFGADKILTAGNDSGVSDADIDTILARSKLRSDAFDRRIVSMDENSLKNLTIEQVEMEYKKPSVEQEGTLFKFEGQDYRELRKRKSKWTEDDTIITGKRRKEVLSIIGQQSIVEYSEDERHAEDTSFVVDESESSDCDFEIVPAHPVPAQSLRKNKKPKQRPHTFQFYSPFIWEIYWQELDYFRKCSADYKLDLPTDVPNHIAEMLTSSERIRLDKCYSLSSVDQMEKQELMQNGFKSWKKKHFAMFVDSLSTHGSEKLEVVSSSVTGKTIEEVVGFSQVFWLKCQELLNFEELMTKLGHVGLIHERRKAQQDLITKKIKSERPPAEVNILYEPKHWIGKRFSKEDDANLLMQLAEIGMQTSDPFGQLRSKLIHAEDCSAFLRSRTTEELQTRFNLLLHMIEKEFSCIQQQSDTLASNIDLPLHETTNTTALLSSPTCSSILPTPAVKTEDKVAETPKIKKQKRQRVVAVSADPVPPVTIGYE